MLKLEKQFKELEKMNATIQFNGGKFMQDLSNYLNDCTEQWVANHVNHYLEITIPPKVGEKNGNQEQEEQ